MVSSRGNAVCACVPECVYTYVHVLLQVEEIVEVGAIEPENVHLPNVFVDRVVLGTSYEKRIEVRSIANNYIFYVGWLLIDI